MNRRQRSLPAGAAGLTALLATGMLFPTAASAGICQLGQYGQKTGTTSVPIATVVTDTRYRSVPNPVGLKVRLLKMERLYKTPPDPDWVQGWTPVTEADKYMQVLSFDLPVAPFNLKGPVYNKVDLKVEFNVPAPGASCQFTVLAFGTSDRDDTPFTRIRAFKCTGIDGTNVNVGCAKFEDKENQGWRTEYTITPNPQY